MQAFSDRPGAISPSVGGIPLVSIITPTYNRAALLDETIRSVLDQGYRSIEYIVLDDGSTDDTPAVIQEHADRVRWARHENVGETRTVNRGLSMARGEVIGVVNSDDPLLPGAVSAAVEALLVDPDVVVVYPDWNVIDEHGNVLHSIRTFDYSLVNMVRWHFSMPGPGTFFRRSVFERLGGRDESFRYVADYDFWLRAGLLGPFRRLPRTLATWRQHGGSATSSDRGDAMAMEHIRVIDKLYAQPDLPPDIQAVRTEAYRNALFVAGTACGADSSDSNERFLLRDALHDRIFNPGRESPLETIGRLHRELVEREERVAEFYEQVVRQRRELEWVHGEVAERDRTIAWLHQEVAKRDQIVASLQSKIHSLRDGAP